MPHKAGDSFFDKKESWSEYKDQILNYYLKPYLAKVSRIGKPITIIDCFAGRGKFKDGKDGSPRIIAKRIQEQLRVEGTPDIQLLAIEKSDGLIEPLIDSLKEYSFASVRHDSFENTTPIIDEVSKTNTVFLYVDPYAIEGLDWNTIEKALSHIKQSQSSIELLMNFNAHAFVRRASAALGKPLPDFAFDTDEARQEHVEDWERIAAEVPTVEKLDKAVGSNWWLQIFRDFNLPSQQRDKLVKGLCSRLEDLGRHAYSYEILEKPHHTTPKYVLVFASRYTGAITLVNEAVVDARDNFVEKHLPEETGLFGDMRPAKWVPQPTDIRKEVREILRNESSAIEREHLVEKYIINHFGIFRRKTIEEQIKAMYEEGEILISDPAKWNKQSLLRIARP